MMIDMSNGREIIAGAADRVEYLLAEMRLLLGDVAGPPLNERQALAIGATAAAMMEGAVAMKALALQQVELAKMIDDLPSQLLELAASGDWFERDALFWALHGRPAAQLVEGETEREALFTRARQVVAERTHGFWSSRSAGSRRKKEIVEWRLEIPRIH